jgi:hypothetical protein
MAYDNKPTRYSFPFPALATDQKYGFRGPKGKAGLLYDYGVTGISTALAGSTTAPKVQVGITATPAAYGTAFDLTTLAVNKGRSVRSTYTPDQAAFDALMINRVIPADTDVEIGLLAGVGTPGGVGNVFCEVIWGT